MWWFPMGRAALAFRVQKPFGRWRPHERDRVNTRPASLMHANVKRMVSRAMKPILWVHCRQQARVSPLSGRDRQGAANQERSITIEIVIIRHIHML